MEGSTFLLPTVLRVGTRHQIVHDDAIGAPDGWIADVTPGDLDAMVDQFAGIMRGLLLAGHQTTAIRIEHVGSRVEVDLESMTAGRLDEDTSDPVAPIRNGTAHPVITLDIRPLPLFGQAAGLPLAIPLTIPSGGGLHFLPTGDGTGHYLVAECTGSTYAESVTDLEITIANAATAIADTLASAWGRAITPNAPAPAGLTSIFDHRRERTDAEDAGWWYPPADPSTRWEASGAHIEIAWRDVLDDLVLDPAGRASWLPAELLAAAGATMTGSTIYTLNDDGSMSLTDVRDAYERRLTEIINGRADAHRDTFMGFGDLTITDAILSMVEHGVIDPFGEVTLRAAPLTPIEWTDPCLTGAWHADVDATSDHHDVLLLNQAGAYVEGFLFRREPTGWNGSHDIDGYALSVDLTQPDGDGTHSGDLWELHESTSNDVSTTPIADLAETDAAPVLVRWETTTNGPQLYVSDVAGYSRSFTHRHRAAHLTNLFLHRTGLPALVEHTYGPEPEDETEPGPMQRLRDQVRDVLRDAHRIRRQQLHHHERELANAIVADFEEIVLRWDSPLGPTNDQAINELDTSLVTHIGGEMWGRSDFGTPASYSFSEVGFAIGREVRQQLALQTGDDGGITTIQQIVVMMANASDLRVAEFLGLDIQQRSGEEFWYQFRLTEVSGPPGVNVFGGAARRWGKVQFRRCIPTGQPYPGHSPTPPYDVYLYTTSFSTSPGLEWGIGPIPDWTQFDYAADHDLEPYLSDAQIDFSSPLTVSVGPLSSNAPVDVTLRPSDRSMVLQAQMSGKYLDVPIFTESDSLDDVRRHQDQIKKWRDYLKAARDAAKHGARGLGKHASKFKPGATWFQTFGMIGSDLDPNAPPPFFLVDPADVDISPSVVSLFETQSHHYKPEFLVGLRRFLAAFLPALTGPYSDITAIGHSSHSGPEDYNQDLSERRAVTVLEAVRNLLGPQLGVGATHQQAIGRGESEASGGPEDNRPSDRRTDLTISGFVTMRM